MKTRIQMLTTFMFIIALVLIAPCAYGLDTTRVSVSTATVQSNNNSFLPALNENGQFVVFHSFANNLVAGDTNGERDVFVHNRLTGQTTRVSVATGGIQANALSRVGDLSNDGNLVSFQSEATNLVPGDTNAKTDVFVHDRGAVTTMRVSVATGGVQANGDSFNAQLSGDGRFVVFESEATNLVAGDTNGDSDIFVHELQTGTTTRVSLATGAVQATGESFLPTISNDGRFVVFESEATNLVAGDTNGDSDIFVHELQTGTTTRVSLATGAVQATGESFWPTISNDGRFVVFESEATNLVVGDTNGFSDLFRHDRQTGATVRVSVPTGGSPQSNEDSFEPAISGDGRFVAFLSFASNLVPADTNGEGDVFVHDTQTNTTTRMSVSTAGVQGNDFSCNPAISQDGRIVGFFSDSNNLVPGDTNGARDIFTRDRTVDYDVNGEGQADLIWYNTSTGAVVVWFLNANGTRNSSGFPGGAPSPWTLDHVADVNGDGRADLIWHNTSTGAVVVWFLNANGTRNSSGFPGGAPSPWALADVADVNGDGRADLIWHNGTTGAVVVWFLNADGTRNSNGFPGGAPSPWTLDHVADVNGDGRADLIWHNTSTGAVVVWFLNANGTRSSNGFPGGVPSPWALADVADVNGDGRADLIWHNGTTGAVVVWFLNADGTRSSSGFPGGAPSPWALDPMRDVNGDGRADLIWHNTSTGAVVVWFLNANGTRSSSGFPGGAPSPWELP